MLKDNFLKKKFISEDLVIGTWCNIPSAHLTDVIASTGIDFLIVDMEHGPISFETAQMMVIVCEARGVSPMVRVSGVVESEILKALDIGAHGIHVPNVSSIGNIRDLLRYAKYPPAGSRGFSPFTRSGFYSHLSSTELMDRANSNTLIAIHIEGEEAITRTHEFLEIPEIDIFYLGLYDLSKSIGLAGEVNHPKVLQLLKETVRKVAVSGKIAGTIITDVQQIPILREVGIKYFTYSVDCEVVSTAYRRISEVSKNILL